MSDGDRPSCSARDCTNPVVGSFAWRGQRYYYCEDHNFSGPHGDLAPQVEVPAASSLTVQQLSQAFEHLPAIELPGHAERIGRRVYESVIGPDDTCMFLVWDGSSFGFQNLILLSDRVARPLKMDGLPYEPYRVESFDESELARLEGIAIDPRSLYDEVKLQFDSWISIQAEDRIFSTTQVLETYQQHKLTSTYYPFGVGAKGSGKNAWLELFRRLCYRPMFSANLRAPHAYRFLGAHGKGYGCLIIDEAHECEREPDLLALFRTGHLRDGAPVPRLFRDPETKKLKNEFFHTYCSKILAGWHMPRDAAFRDRCKEIIFVEDHSIPSILTDSRTSDHERWAQLRFKLLLWRMRTFFDPLPELQNDFPLKGRPRDLWKPKVMLGASLGNNNPVLELAETDWKLRQAQRKESFEARLYEVAVEACNHRKTFANIPFVEIWDLLGKHLEVTRSGDTLESDTYGKITKAKVGFELGNKLGGVSSVERVEGKPMRVTTFDPDVLLKAKRMYHSARWVEF